MLFILFLLHRTYWSFLCTWYMISFSEHSWFVKTFLEKDVFSIKVYCLIYTHTPPHRPSPDTHTKDLAYRLCNLELLPPFLFFVHLASLILSGIFKITALWAGMCPLSHLVPFGLKSTLVSGSQSLFSCCHLPHKCVRSFIFSLFGLLCFKFFSSIQHRVEFCFMSHFANFCHSVSQIKPIHI